ncbi:MAG: hypothetical protein ACI4JY_01670 [Oscillospiraceae bacterium]
MKKTIKKIMAAAAAAVLAASLSGCMDNGYIMTVDGMKIRNGVYLSLEQTSINLANQKINEQESETENTDTSSDTSSNSEEEDIFTKVIDGKSYSDWIIEDTRKGVLRFVGIQRQCEEYGIALSEEEIADISQAVNAQWEDTTIAYYGLGFENWGQYYESMGIGKDSFKELSIVDALNEKLFLHYYDEGGEWAVSEEEFLEAANEEYAAYNLISFQYVDYKGDILITDEEKQEVKDMGKAYADRINSGESLIDVMYDYYLFSAQNKARTEAEEEYTAENSDGMTKEEYVEKAVSEVTVERAESEKEFDEFISKEESVLTEELTEYLFGLPADGKAYYYEGTTSVYVVTRKPVTDLENWETYYRSTVLRKLKGDEFDSKMDIMCQNYSVEQNDYLVNTKYSPKKILNK